MSYANSRENLTKALERIRANFAPLVVGDGGEHDRPVTDRFVARPEGWVDAA